MAKDDWFRASDANPCPICSGTDKKCSIAKNGSAVLCQHVKSDDKRPCGRYRHSLKDRQWIPAPTQGKPSPGTKVYTGKKSRFPTFQTFLKNAKVHPDWCARYSVPQSVWQSLGASGDKNELKVPERWIDVPGKVIGVVTRKATNDHNSRWRASGQRGSTFPWIPNHKSIAVLILEGASDCACCLASGLDPISRYTRNQALEPVAELLRKVREETPVVVLVENDKQGDEQVQLFSEACDRAQKLANKAMRPIVVASPPIEFNDFADWWRAITNNKGHRMSERDRFSKGQTMLKHFLSSGTEILPGLDELRAIYQRSADETECNVNLHVKSLQESATVDGWIDRDYQRQDSCGLPSTLYRKEEMSHEIMVSFLGCKRWSCPVCRARILKPTWKIHFNHLFANEPQVIYRVLASNLSEAESIKKSIIRVKGQFIRFQFLEGRCAIYSNHITEKIESTVFDCRRFPFHFDRLSEQISEDIESIDTSLGKLGHPISTSRAWKLVKDDSKAWTLLKSRTMPNDVRELAKNLELSGRDLPVKVIGSVRDRFALSIPKNPTGEMKRKKLFSLMNIQGFEEAAS